MVRPVEAPSFWKIALNLEINKWYLRALKGKQVAQSLGLHSELVGSYVTQNSSKHDCFTVLSKLEVAANYEVVFLERKKKFK